MTGFDIYKKAVSLLDGDCEAKIQSGPVPLNAVTSVNCISLDLGLNTVIADIFDKITVPSGMLDTFYYGVAMMLASIENDTEHYNFFRSVYSGKRAAVKSNVGTVKNVMPIGG